MSEIHEPTTTDVLRSLRLIRSPEADERLRALRVLSALRDDPRVAQVFEHLYKNDPDAEVRVAAWQALNQTGPSIPAPIKASRPVTFASPAPPSAPVAVKGTRSRSNTPFLLDTANAQRLKRHVRQQKRRGRFALLLALLVLIAALVLIARIFPDWETWYKLRQRGITLEGTIIERYEHDSHYYLQYRFEVAENSELVPYVGEQRVTATAYRSYQIDAPVTVTYLHGAPTTSRLAVHNLTDERRNRLTAASAGLMGVVVVLFGLSVVQRFLPNWLPQGQSTLLRGQIITCKGRRDDDGDFKITVEYRFRTPSGAIIVGQVRQLRNDLKQAALPAPGTPVVVAYHRTGTHELL